MTIPLTRRDLVFLTILSLCATAFASPAAGQRAAADEPERTAPLLPVVVGHRGLLHAAPENTLPGFAACLELRLGFELDVRRTKDGRLVCLHDAVLQRTTTGKGRVADLSFAELRRLDAGVRFDPAFAGQRVPALEEVFALFKEPRAVPVLVTLDFKSDDATVEADVVALAQKYGVLKHVVCIGRAITEPAVRRKLRAADPHTPVAVLVPAANDLPAALADPDADWVYLRWLPTPAQVGRIHGAGKRIFQSGPLVGGREPDNWRRARSAGVDALLTDFPLDCRQTWK
jgi:glycerophosphoryl diester phosphodiesterase